MGEGEKKKKILLFSKEVVMSRVIEQLLIPSRVFLMFILNISYDEVACFQAKH